MKRTVIHIIAIIGFAICSASYTQAQHSDVYDAEIPFDFQIGKKVFPAGEYRLEVRGAEQKYFVLSDRDGLSSHMVNSMPGRSIGVGKAKIDFARVGGRYYVASLRVSDRTSLLPKPSSDDALARDTEEEKVTVALSGGRKPNGGR
jgi:hypothetical protein